jgi:hypothetical protein
MTNIPPPSSFPGEQRLFTSSSAEFTLLFCAQATSEALGEVLVVDKDETDRESGESKPHVHTHRASHPEGTGHGGE